MDLTVQRHRAEQANALLVTIARHGRHFFCHRGVVSWLEVDDRGRVWFTDSYRGARIYTHYVGRWRGFTQGGTLKALIEDLRTYIKTGRQLSRGRFWWPDWYCGGDLWGYGEAMIPVREHAERLGIVTPPPEEDTPR
jgi:hypothetical protein